MKFSCNKKDLSEAINNVLPAVTTKTTLIALEGILMQCENNSLKITGYNLELGIAKSVFVKSTEDGSIILNATLLANIINKMPDGEVSFKTDEKLLTIIECNDIEFTILGLNAEEYPDMPAISNDKEFSIAHHLLKNMISQTLFSVAQNDQNPILTGSLFDIKDSILYIVSVDGVRLALRKEKINVSENFQFVVPGKTLAEIVKLLSRLVLEDDDETVKVSVSNKHISFSINGYIIISRLLEGNFLDYETAIPKETQTTITIETRSFLDSINRASIIINERAKSPVKCTFANNNIKLFCETSIGKVNDSIHATIEGPEVKIGFNNRFMADALKASECETLKLEINGPISPIKILPLDDDSFLFLVLPVRLKS
ncbi:MAG: DNA polymerase III subunit beta [Oscillospiraceae bacterium]